MNIKEEYRQSPNAWVPVGMIPHYSKGLDTRPDAGGNSSSMRQCEIIQACYHLLLKDFNEKTKDELQMEWADGLFYPTRVSLACLLADQPECDKFCCNNSNCHHCWVQKTDLLNLELELSLKSAEEVKSKVLEAAHGIVGVDPHTQKRVILEGATQKQYDQAKAQCGGFHLMNNAFWYCHDFDVHKQIMRCAMHGVDLGIIKTILTGCIHKLQEVLHFNGIIIIL